MLNWTNVHDMLLTGEKVLSGKKASYRVVCKISNFHLKKKNCMYKYIKVHTHMKEETHMHICKNAEEYLPTHKNY